MYDFEKKNYLLLEQYERVNANFVRRLEYCTAYKTYIFTSKCKNLSKCFSKTYEEINKDIQGAIKRLGKITCMR